MGKLGLLLLVCILSVGGFVNYQRNLAVEQEVRLRPYADLGSEDLETLIRAYEQDVAEAEDWLGDAPQEPSATAMTSRREGKRSAFERFRQDTRAWDERRQAVLDREVMLEALQAEHAIRQRGLDRRWREILSRLLSF